MFTKFKKEALRVEPRNKNENISFLRVDIEPKTFALTLTRHCATTGLIYNIFYFYSSRNTIQVPITHLLIATQHLGSSKPISYHHQTQSASRLRASHPKSSLRSSLPFLTHTDPPRAVTVVASVRGAERGAPINLRGRCRLPLFFFSRR